MYICQNVTLTNANTEYSYTLTRGSQVLEFQARTAVDIRYAFVTGKVATPTAPYMTLKSGTSFWDPLTQLAYDFATGNDLTLYLASATAGTVVEILTS